MSLPSTYVPNFHNVDEIKKMKYVEFGNTGMIVSKISFGAAEFSNIYGDYEFEECKRALEKALKSGINYIDTAYWYGQNVSQQNLGKILNDIPRESYYLATKIGRYELDPKQMFDFSSEKTKWGLENNLKTLGLNYIDVILVHDIEFAPSVEYVIENTLPVLDEARKNGIVKFIGVSAYPVSVLQELVQKSNIKIDMILSYSRFNLFDQTLKTFVPFFEGRKMGVVSAAPLAMGLLSNPGPQPWHPAPSEIKDACEKARNYCKSNGVELARLAIYYTLKEEDPYMHTQLIGMKSVDQLDKNLDVYFNGITGKEKEVLEYIKENYFAGLKIRHWEGIEIENYKKAMNN